MLRTIFFSTLSLALVTSASCAAFDVPAFAEVVRQDDAIFAGQPNMPVCVWKDPSRKPKAIVLAIHGLTLHGTTYDACARYLARHGVLVAAPDLRGYGRWYESRKAATAAYKDSENDLALAAASLRAKYPGVPLFLAGESLGGTMAIRVAAHHADLVDGLILSAPALRHHYHLPLRTAAGAALAMANPWHKVDVSGYIRNYFSDDPRVAQEEITDPLVRKNLSLGELMSSCHVIASTIDCISDIPGDMPVLIMQGKNDQMIKASSIDILRSRLRSKSTSVTVFPNRGHILLETAHVQKETLETVCSWLDRHCFMRTQKETRVAVAMPDPDS